MFTQTSSHLAPGHRTEAFHRLATENYDVIVVGGGVTGAGVALDAASRGLRTALVERVDLAAGTSRWSSKLAHGGLRYLAKADFGVAWESAMERSILMRIIAPHLARPTPFLVPLNRSTGPMTGILAEVGVRLGDLMRVASRTPASVLAPPTRISAARALGYAPGLDPEGLRGALLYWDGQLEDDARLVIDIARTAHKFGADIVTRCAASDLTDDRLTLTDTLTGQSCTARGTVINATGVWAAEHDDSLTMSPSRGTHLVLRGSALGNPTAVFTAPVPDHFGRFVFALPQTCGLVYVGLTDEPADGADPIAPPVPQSDVTFLLETLSRVLARPLTADDVVGRFAGLRPLIRTAEGATPDISRKHLLVDEPGRPITIAGGKLTTYRRMAQDAVDAACRRLGQRLPCRTKTLHLVGAGDLDVVRALRGPAHLLYRYGTSMGEVFDLAHWYPWLRDPVAPGCPTIGAEFAFGVLAEGAMTAEDLIERRTRVSMVEADIDSARAVAEKVIAEFAGG